MSYKGFDLAFPMGRSTEALVAEWLREEYKFCVISVGKWGEGDNRGPSIMIPNIPGGLLVSPDLLVVDVANAREFFVEVKKKSEFTFFRNAQKWQTGVNEAHFSHYLQVSASTGKPVYLYFVHSSMKVSSEYTEEVPKGGIYCQEVTVLQNKYHHANTDNYGTRLKYWNVSDLTYMGNPFVC